MNEFGETVSNSLDEDRIGRRAWGSLVRTQENLQPTKLSLSMNPFNSFLMPSCVRVFVTKARVEMLCAYLLSDRISTLSLFHEN